MKGMRIVNREEFLQMPEGTVYSHYAPQVADGLMIKGKTWENDWLYQDLLFNVEGESADETSDKLNAAEENGLSFKLDLNCYSRDGMFDNDQLFMVYGQSDVLELIKVLASGLITNVQAEPGVTGGTHD